ncbi:uncharacterized protein LOC116850767 [Odontomachus brunneus]|uniref:uncharacterized protein LOC116850767 n=1 Tax=Odontomachus brunneus TaxID=486640 RepID=UPI0013F243E8|nr:uncharacterized protein LOC116850767 [Odontomachus brunneus]
MDSVLFAMGWCKYNMTFLGVWPEPGKASQTKQRLSNLIFWSSAAIVLLFVNLPIFGHLFVTCTNLDDVIGNLSLNVPTFYAFIKQLFLRYNKKNYKSIPNRDLFQALTLLVRQMLDDWTGPISEAERQAMLKSAKKSHVISILSSLLTYLLLIALATMSIWNNMHQPIELEFEPDMPFPTVFPYNLKNSPVFELTWLGENMGAFVTAICYTCFDTFLAVLILHLCGQLAVLKINLKNLVVATQHDGFVEFYKKLGCIVQRHEELYRYATVVEDYFNLALLVQTVISTAMFCLTIYRLITTMNQYHAVTEIIYLTIHVMYTTIHFFLYCYIGEQLLSESSSITQTAFDCEWYDLPPKKAISLTIIMMRANISFKLTAGKFSPFSLDLFSTVNFNFAIGWNRFNLGLIGVWPDPLQSPGKRGGLSQLRFLTASFFMLSFMCIPQLVNLFFIWGNADMMTENLAIANIPMANAFMKAVTMWRHRKVLKQLVEFFYQDWHASKTSYERTAMLKNASVVRNISIWCMVLTQTVVILYVILRILTNVKLQRNNSTRLMMCTAYFPFDITQSPVFELIYVCQVLSAFSGAVSYTGSDSFVSMLVLHVCGQFQNLRRRLKNLVDDSGGVKTTEDFRNELAQIVKRHEHLNWFVNRIEDSFNIVFLFQIFSCTVQLCFQGFQVFNILINNGDKSPTCQLIFLVIFVTFVLVHLYVYCYVGEMLLVQSTEISFSAYESNWFNVPGKEARSLLFIMCRSTVPLSLTAGKFGVFSLQLFSKIVKTSLGYLSVLLTVTNRKE